MGLIFPAPSLNLNQLGFKIYVFQYLFIVAQGNELITHFTMTIIIANRSWEEKKIIKLDVVEREHSCWSLK